MQIIITAAGLGQRFKDAGYTEPKPIIPVLNKPALQYLLDSFDPNWKVICVLGEHFLESGIENIIQSIKPDIQFAFVGYSNRGPIDTVLAAVPMLDPTDSVAVSYCDFAMVWNNDHFNRFVAESDCDVCITSYRGFHPTYLGPNTYAHLLVDEKTAQVQKIQEKKIFGTNIEDEWSSTGFYYFKSVDLLKKGVELQLFQNLKYGNEYYTSLAIQALMNEAEKTNKSLKILNYEISHFMQMGTPADVKLIEDGFKIFEKSNDQNISYSSEQEQKLSAYWKSLFETIKK